MGPEELDKYIKERFANRSVQYGGGDEDDAGRINSYQYLLDFS